MTTMTPPTHERRHGAATHDRRERLTPLRVREPSAWTVAPWGQGTGPFSTLSVAADAAVRDLQARCPLDLWLVTQVDGDRQRVLAAAGPWAERSDAAELAWPAALSTQLVADGCPAVSRDLARTPGFAARAAGQQLVPNGWVGVPLVSAHGAMYGSLCGLARSAQDAALDDALEPAQVMGRLLSTIVAGEQVVEQWEATAAATRSRLERDQLTGLLDRRGFNAALAAEAKPSRRFGTPTSLLVLDVDDLHVTNESEGHAAGDAVLAAVVQVLQETCWPEDVVARVDGDEFAVLAVECDAVSIRVLASRIKVRLRAVGVSAAVGWATGKPREPLDLAWERAEVAMAADKRRHHRR